MLLHLSYPFLTPTWCDAVKLELPDTVAAVLAQCRVVGLLVTRSDRTRLVLQTLVDPSTLPEHLGHLLTTATDVSLVFAQRLNETWVSESGQGKRDERYCGWEKG